MGESEQTEVGDKQSRKITFYGSRLLIKTPTFYRDSGLKFTIFPNSVSVLVPIDEKTKASLETVEGFVKEQVAGERYKPLFLGEASNIKVSKFCKYEQVMPDGTIQPLVDFLGCGDYVITIHVSHCYIGPHRDGSTYSINMQVASILYHPRPDEEEDVMDLIETLSQDLDTFGPPLKTSTPVKQQQQQQQQQSMADMFISTRPTSNVGNGQRKKRGGRMQRGFDEVDGPTVN